MKKYIIDENNNAIEVDLMTWEKFLENHQKKRIVSKDNVNDLEVATVFIGLDHYLSPFNNTLYIFETTIFKKDGNKIRCDRYSTWQEALDGHKKAIEWVNNGCKDE